MCIQESVGIGIPLSLSFSRYGLFPNFEKFDAFPALPKEDATSWLKQNAWTFFAAQEEEWPRQQPLASEFYMRHLSVPESYCCKQRS